MKKYWDEMYWKVVNSESESERMVFLKQIAADQREACAIIAEQTYNNPPNTDDYLITEIIKVIRNAEISLESKQNGEVKE